MDPYKYRPLEPGNVRFLKFRALQSEELVFDITHGTIDSSSPIKGYAALSYVWGDPKLSARIRIGDEYIAVTQNLSDALTYIKKYYAEKFTLSSILFWVDAVCIDQKDDEEKSGQVKIMHDIYENADKVFVWFGHPSDDRTMQLATTKLDYLRKLSHQAVVDARGGYRPWWWPKDKITAQKDRNALSALIYKNIKKIFDPEATNDLEAWRAIVELWSNPWWKRAWVAQEGTVKEPYKIYMWMGMKVEPKPKVFFLCGRHVTHWGQFFASYLVSGILLKMPLLSLSTGFMTDAALPMRRMMDIRDIRILGSHVNLLDHLQHTRTLEASDPRDKIYANLGMGTDPLLLNIRPDYSRSTIDIYFDIVRMLQWSQPSLDFLGYAMKLDEPRRPLHEDLSHQLWPSWIPNWDDPLNIFPLPKNLYKLQSREDGRTILRMKTWAANDFEPMSKAYNATRDRPVRASMSNYELRIQGAIIDIIDERHSYQEGTAAERQARINRWYNAAGQKYVDGTDWNKAVRRTQVADLKYHFRTKPIARGGELNRPLLDKRHAALTDEERSAQAEMKIALDCATIYRGLALTHRGYLGMVPWSARQGDSICILLGGQVLYVLRAKEGSTKRYEYIGECYVHGLMDGEALDWVERGNSVVEDFVLV